MIIDFPLCKPNMGFFKSKVRGILIVQIKEEHAALVKHEIRIIWGDYFKPVFVKEYPNLHELVFETMKLASNARQEVDEQSANDLLESVQKIAEIFWKTKGKDTVRVKTTFPTEKEIVVPKQKE